LNHGLFVLFRVLFRFFAHFSVMFADFLLYFVPPPGGLPFRRSALISPFVTQQYLARV
jgi:hypothetical protein